MAKTGNIDPAFQAAPILEEPTYDPAGFVRRHKLARYQEAKRKQEETEKNLAKGLDLLMVDLKGWDDKSGFEEIAIRQDKAYKMYIGLAMKGVNFVTPKTTADLMARKALMDYLAETQELADIRNSQKVLLELDEKALKEDALKPEGEQRLDQQATRANINEARKDNTLRGRQEKFNNLLVPIVRPVDIINKITEAKAFYIPPKQTQRVTFNEETGRNETIFEESMDPKDEVENLRRAGVQYEGFAPADKKAITRMREADPDPQFNVMSDKDYFKTIAVPTYRKKFLEKSTGAGGGFAINFLGQKTTMGPGRQRKEPLPYGERTYTSAYEFTNTKPIKVNYGSAGSSIFMGDQWVSLEKGGDVEAELRFYDSNRDEFVFRSTQTSVYPWMQNNMTFAVPRSVIGDQADNLRIEVNGKIVKLKDVYGTMKEEKKKLPGIDEGFWSEPIYTPKNK